MDLPSFHTSIAFFGIALLISFTPGPDNLFVLMESAKHGRKAGFCVVLGLCVGLVVHTLLVAFGLAAVFAASPAAFKLLKFAGSAYLVYLAYRAFCAPAASPTGDAPPARSAMRMLGKGVVLNLTNPKVVIFFLAFLPQFVEPGSHSVAWQICALGLLFIAAVFLAFSLINYFAGLLSERFLNSRKAQRALNVCAGLIFLGLAIRLALSEQ